MSTTVATTGALEAPASVRPLATAALSGHGVSWGAIFAGAAASAALSLILAVLGVGLGFSAISPWADNGTSATAFGMGSAIWIAFTAIAASGLGGYIAGRLRTRWDGLHGDEVYFRDTAHGFIAWCVATLATAAFLGGAIGSIAGAGLHTAGALAGGATAAAAGAAAQSGGSDDLRTRYLSDALLRRDASAPLTAPAGSAMIPAPSTPADDARTSSEAARILATSLANGSLAPDDTRYLGQLVAQRTGLAQADAEKRVTDTFTRMQAALNDAKTAAAEATDKARKASAYGALWLFVSLLIGAFVASLAATYGGRRRDA